MAYQTHLDAAKSALSQRNNEGMIHHSNLLLACPDAPISHQAGANIMIASASGQSDPTGAARCCKKALGIVEELEARPQPEHVSVQDVKQMKADAEVILAAVDLLQTLPAEEATKLWGSLNGGSK